MNQETKDRIKEHVMDVMEAKIRQMTIENPFNAAHVEERNPFGFRLVPLEVWQGSKFERSFVTSLGQGIFEQVAQIIAEGTGSYSEIQNRKDIRINTFQSQTIDAILDRASRREGNRIVPPDLQEELQELRALHNPDYTDKSIISDLYIQRPNGDEEFYSLKTVKPNIDQTNEAKKRLLLLRTALPDAEAFFALPYNPAGEGRPYSECNHSQPRKAFDMEDSNFVLKGGEFWNKVGDDANTFDELLTVFEEAGRLTSDRIRSEYFGIDD